MVKFVIAPFHFGQKKIGVDLAGSTIIAKLETPADKIIKCQPLTPDHFSDADNGLIYKPEAVAESCKRVYEGCYAGVMGGACPENPLVILGGDHATAIGSISGTFDALADLSEKKNKQHDSLLYMEPLVIWFDAHADINTLKTTASGNIHGCPVAFLLNHPDTRGLSPFNWFYSAVDKYSKKTGHTGYIVPSRLAYIGLRDVEDGEKLTMEELAIHDAWFMEDVKEAGRDVKRIVGSILANLDPEGRRPIHLSLDVDGMDPLYIPSTGTPVPDGMMLEETLEIVDLLKATGRLVSIDIVEVNLLLGSEEDSTRTLSNTLKVIERLTS